MSAVYLDTVWSSDGTSCWVTLGDGSVVAGEGPGQVDARRDLAKRLRQVPELEGASVIVRSRPLEGSSQTVVMPDGQWMDLPDPPPVDTNATPGITGAALVRVDFSDERSWQELLHEVRRPSPEGFVASVTIVERAELAGATSERVVEELGLADSPLVLVADARGMSGVPRSVVAVCGRGGRLRTFRVASVWAWSVENNLTLGNMGWDEFAAAAGAGTFEGFDGP